MAPKLTATPVSHLIAEYMRRSVSESVRGHGLHGFRPSRKRVSVSIVSPPGAKIPSLECFIPNPTDDRLWPWGEPSYPVEYGEYMKFSPIEAGTSRSFRRVVADRMADGLKCVDKVLCPRGGGVHGDAVTVIVKRAGPTSYDGAMTMGWKSFGYPGSRYVPSPEFGTDCI